MNQMMKQAINLGSCKQSKKVRIYFITCLNDLNTHTHTHYIVINNKFQRKNITIPLTFIM